MWAFRALAEASLHRENWFLTLTYAPEHLPPYGELRHRDWQLFAKRVRKRSGPFRYLMCGEYGDQTHRPHYHALVFGLGVPDRVLFTERQGHPVFQSEVLSALWGLGHIEFGTVTASSARYCAGYVLKDSRAPVRLDESTGEVVPLQPPYGRMSLKPGLGDLWIRRYYPEVLTHGSCFSQDKRFPIPRRFAHILDSIAPDSFAELQERSIEKARSSLHNTSDRLAVREQLALATRARYKEVRDHAL